MLNILNTIIPIFAIILLGVVIRYLGFLPEDLIGPLNRLVYYLAIPAMIFQDLASASFQSHFNPLLVAGTLIPLIAVVAASICAGLLFKVNRSDFGTFLQSSFHGNLGYIGLAVAYYFLDGEGFTSAVILAGFLMLLQNLFAVLGLQIFIQNPKTDRRAWFFIKKIVGNPVILSAVFGIAFSISGIDLPKTVDRSLTIISGMALPLALLVIGASLAFNRVRVYLSLALLASILKLIILPAAGFMIYRRLGLLPAQFLPGIVLLAAPSATITYVMATEMQGSPDLASTTISLNTMMSCLTFIFWLGIAG